MAQPPVQDSERTQAPHIEWVHYTILFIHFRYANLHYLILSKDYLSSGCVERATLPLPFFDTNSYLPYLYAKYPYISMDSFLSIRGHFSPSHILLLSTNLLLSLPLS